jgi:hypothetical protein
MRMISWWISSRSSGVLNEVCSRAMVSWVILSAEVRSRRWPARAGPGFGPLPQIIHQGHQSPPALDDQIRMRIEQIEELGLFGHQLGEHRIPPLTIEHFNFISLWRQIRPSANW